MTRFTSSFAGAVAGVFFAVASLPAIAAGAQADALSGVSGYFNSISTMNGEFLQIGPNGEQAEGKFFMEKPGKIRFHYAEPVFLDIISDGRSVAIRDRKLATQDTYPLSKTPLKFLLSKDIDLTSDERVTAVLQDEDFVTIELTEKNMFGKGKITLYFDSDDYTLKQWVVTDAQGLNTSVTIFNVETGRPQAKRLFKINRMDYNRSRDG